MRKYFALTVVALLALTLVLAAMGCGKKAEESAPATETPTSETMMADSMMSDTSAMDTTMHQ